MKILFVTPYYKPYLGGIERVIEKLSGEFQQRGHEVGVLTTKWIFPNTPREKRQYRQDFLSIETLPTGEQVYRIDSFPQTAPPFYQVPLVWMSPLQIRNVINTFEPDVIQLMSDRWFLGNFCCWIFRGDAHIAFSLSFHDLRWGSTSNPILWTLKQFLKLINGFLTRKVEWVQVITQLEKETVQQAYKTPVDKIQVIPWGVEVKERSKKLKVKNENVEIVVEKSGIDNVEDRKQKVGSEKPVAILAVGRLSEHKGQEWLCEVITEVSRSTDNPINLTLVGKDEGLGTLLRKKFVDTDTFALSILGEVSDAVLENEYHQADVFALFPEYEAFGLVFLEALAHRVPVVTHSVGAISEVLQAGAVVVEPYNKAQAKVVLSKLIEDAKERTELGREGYEYVMSHFSWKRTAARFLEEYNKRS